MTIAVDLGRKATKQTQPFIHTFALCDGVKRSNIEVADLSSIWFTTYFTGLVHCLLMISRMLLGVGGTEFIFFDFLFSLK